MTLTQKIVDYVTTNPGKTATEVAHGIDGDPATVSGIRCRLTKQRNGLRYKRQGDLDL